MTVPSTSAQSQFVAAVEDALKHYSDSQWLGDFSPLASPYLLTNQLTIAKGSAHSRGEALQRLLAEAIDGIQGRNNERYQTILRAYYLDGGTVAQVGKLVGLAKNSFHLNRKAAIDGLAEVLVSRLHPALRLERPPTVFRLLERDELLAQSTGLLGSAQTLALVGGGGIGKTVLGAMIAQKMDRPIFWYTIRSGLTDQLENLFFALGLFFHEQGISSLWLEVVATNGRIGYEKGMSMVRFALAEMKQTPLLCFDDIDILQADKQPTHAQWISFVEGLHGLAPMLLMGQRVPIAADQYLQFQPLSLPASRELLLETKRNGETIRLQHGQLTHFYRQTQGNPRLLQLCRSALGLKKDTVDLDEILRDSMSVDALLRRIVGQFGETEREVLTALCVYRNPAPAYVWQTKEHGPGLLTLVNSHLVQLDDRGGAMLVPVYGQRIYQDLPIGIRKHLHTMAADVRRTMGAYTAAAYHLIQAGQAEEAIWLWRGVQVQEIAQGQATAAGLLFRPLFEQQLRRATRETLTILCSDLERFSGNLKQAATDLEQTSIHTPILAIEAGELAGMIANDQSEFDHAEEVMQESLRLAEELLQSQVARIRKGLGWLHMRQRSLDKAEHELILAQYEIEKLRGKVAFERCEYDLAEVHYEQAQQLAESIQDQEAMAKTENDRAAIYLFRGEHQTCIGLLSTARKRYEKIGKTLAMAGTQITQAVAHNQSGDYQAALNLLHDASKLIASSTSAVWLQALIAQARAESYLGLNLLEQAEEQIQQAIELEEIDILPDAYRVYGEILLRREELENAEHALQRALALAEENADPYLCGYTWRALGMLNQKRRHVEGANQAFAQALDIFESINLPNEVERTLTDSR
ncbi:MAG: hypothetical protein AAF702_42515 [Chloroflexota bacterium]